MKKELKQSKAEKDQLITQLVDNTFSKLSCRMHGVGMYDELKNAIVEAYRLGKNKRKHFKEHQVIDLALQSHTKLASI